MQRIFKRLKYSGKVAYGGAARLGQHAVHAFGGLGHLDGQLLKADGGVNQIAQYGFWLVLPRRLRRVWWLLVAGLAHTAGLRWRGRRWFVGHRG